MGGSKKCAGQYCEYVLKDLANLETTLEEVDGTMKKIIAARQKRDVVKETKARLSMALDYLVEVKQSQRKLQPSYEIPYKYILIGR